MLAERQAVEHASQPVARQGVAGRPPEPKADVAPPGRSAPTIESAEHRLLPAREDVGHEDRRDRPQAAGDQDEREQVSQEQRVEGRAAPSTVRP